MKMGPNKKNFHKGQKKFWVVWGGRGKSGKVGVQQTNIFFISGLIEIFLIRATLWENLFMLYANNKGADQPAHSRSLISAFVVRCLDSLIPLVSISKISSL